jgi:hypothetical protein
MGLLDGTTQRSYYQGSTGGDYQFTSLDNIISGFMVAYVGEGKVISKASRTDVQFHGMRAIQEFSYDIFRSVKAQEVEVPNTLKMILPQDYVNYTKITTVGSSGVEASLYPTGKTSNPFAIKQTDSGDYDFNQENLRKITVTVPAAVSIDDGDYLKLYYLTPSGSISSVFFIFDNDNNVNDGVFPSVADTSPRFGVQKVNGETASETGERLKAVLNNSGYFTATHSSGVVTIEYKDILSSYSSEEVKQADGTNELVISIAVLNTGATAASNNLQYQTESNTWTNYKTQVPASLGSDDYETDYYPSNSSGGRYGLDPQHAHSNGTFYIDANNGFIHFGSNLAGKTVVLHYISDGLGTDSEMVVHKFAEEAVYKWIAYGIISSRSRVPEHVVQRFKKEKFAEARKAKIRLSNIKIEEFAQVLKGLGKPIK